MSNANAKPQKIAWVLFAYAVVWLAADRLAFAYSSHATPWYLGTALSFYLLYTFGVRYAPAVVVIEVLRGFLSSRHHLTFEWLFVLGVVTAAVVAAAAAILRRYNVRIFASFNDAILYMAAACIAMPLVRALLGVLVLCLCGDTPWTKYWPATYSFGLGDAVGMLSLVPLLVVFVTPQLVPETAGPEDPAEAQISLPETLFAIALLLGGVIGGYYIVATQNSSEVFYLLFIPLTWLALRGGLRFAIAGIIASDLAVVVLHRWFHTLPSATAAYQSYLAGSSFTTLMLGVVVSQRRREEREAVERARRDPVTGLLNRQAFETWLNSALQDASFTVLKVDFPSIRLADEWLGQDQVFELQKAAVDRLRSYAPEAPAFARIRMGRFVLAFPGEDAVRAQSLAEHIVFAFESPVQAGTTELFITPHVGIASARKGSTAATVLHQAAQAIHRARAEETEIAFYAAPMDGEAPISLYAELNRAVQQPEFCLYYQPIWQCSMRDDGAPAYAELIGAEALLRWNHPDRGTLPPSEFIDLLASTPLSQRVGTWVIEAACRQLSEFRTALPQCTMWINLFARQAYSNTLPELIAKQCEQYAFARDSIVLELNEKMVAAGERDLQGIVQNLHGAGARVAVDDFGKGHSSYARVRDIPFDILKIDRSFVTGNSAEPKHAGVLSSLIHFARSIGVTALAEGVERSEQLESLLCERCPLVQGNLLGPPLDAQAFLELARKQSVRTAT
jgi:EAL domain-containing protein (putative c-di-GMP-specific phosphodiesterase class I)/GGDEF domain-containing protein